MKSVMTHNFVTLPAPSIARSRFDRSHTYKTTFDAGKLIPFYVDEMVPGDTFTMDESIFIRMTTPVAPIMDNLFCDVHYWAVPNRLLWEHWRQMCGQQDTPGASTDYVVPQVSAPAGGWPEGSLGDYFTLPIDVPNIKVSALPFRAYNLIYNEWYRDENLCEPAKVNFGDADDSDTDYVVRKRGKRKDYFTSALPWPQKGDPVQLPLSGNAPIVSDGQTPWYSANGKVQAIPGASGFAFNMISPSTLVGPTVGSWTQGSVAGSWLTSADMAKNPGATPGLFADMSNIIAASVNDLRQAFATQHFLEKQARGGTRYTELVYSHFGVRSSDARLQRPEFIGGDTFRVNFTPVQQTSGTSDVSPQGNLAAFATASNHGHAFTYTAEEHMILIGILSVRADLTYQQGLNRLWSRRTMYDFYWPEFANLGEQPVYNRELYAQGNAEDDGVFGYQERYAEYRYFPSSITGKFRSTCKDSLDVWHLSQKFSSLPKLNATFIEEDVPLQRVLAVQGQPQFIMDSYFKEDCIRPMPTFAIPGLSKL